MAALMAAALWGFAEATFFFLVPDVFLSAVAILDWRLAILACIACLAGALAGGALMYLAGRRGGAGVDAFLLRIPGIGPGMLARVRGEIAARGLAAVLLGPLSGTPYKLYAVEAARQGLSLSALMLVSVPARLLRFAAVTALAGWLAHGAFPGLATGSQLAIWAVSWAVFYAGYFRVLRRRERC